MTSGKLEVIIKISEVPEITDVEKRIIQCDDQTVTTKIKPKTFNKLLETQQFPMWVASIAGKIGKTHATGFELLEPNIQVFEKKTKPPPTPAAQCTTRRGVGHLAKKLPTSLSLDGPPQPPFCLSTSGWFWVSTGLEALFFEFSDCRCSDPTPLPVRVYPLLGRTLCGFVCYY